MVLMRGVTDPTERPPINFERRNRPTPRLRTYTSHIPLWIGAAGVAFGFWGYRQLPCPPSFGDALYSSVRLLVLGAPDPPSGIDTPNALHIARWLCVVAIGSTVWSILARVGGVRVRRVSAWLSSGHRVVIGATPEALQLAVAAEAAASTRRQFRHTVLVAELDDADALALRANDVVVVGPGSNRQLAGALRKAADVVIVEADDIDAMAAATRVVDILGNSPAHIRIILRTAAWARLMRDVHRTGALASARVTIVSLTEAAAIHLSSEEFPPLDGIRREHVVVVGRGELAAEIAAATTRPWAVVGSVPLDLISDDGSWLATTSARLNSDRIPTQSHRVAPTPEEVRAVIRQVCANRETNHLVFLAGLADAEVVEIGLTVAREFDRNSAAPDSGPTRVVGLLSRDLSRGVTPNSETLPTNWWAIPMRTLLEDRNLLLQRLPERLRVPLLRELKLRQTVPGDTALAHLLGVEVPDGPRSPERTVELAAALLEAFAKHGYAPIARLASDQVPMLPVESNLIHVIPEELLNRYPVGSTGMDPGDYRLQLAELTSRLPIMLAGLGYELAPLRKGTGT
jgi:hypothetical protein